MSKKDDAIFGAFLKLMKKWGLSYSDIKTDLDGDVEAITFANNELYINKIKVIETTEEVHIIKDAIADMESMMDPAVVASVNKEVEEELKKMKRRKEDRK